MSEINIIGAGLAGCEAAWQLAKRGCRVNLFEMRPEKMTPAHTTGNFAELVCSNSLRSDQMGNAVGVLKEEMRMLDSLIMHCADACRVPAGSALAVDRDLFAKQVTQMIAEHPLIEVQRQEIIDFSVDEYWIIASGPLTSEALTQRLGKLLGAEYLHFYDALAPIVSCDSIDMENAFWGSRYGKGDDDYLNCPMDEATYNAFWQELITAERFALRDFEKPVYFEGCMPVEEMASRGKQTLLFGPLKPVGLEDPVTGKRYHGVVQLRKENQASTMMNLVGFQTSLLRKEQERVFRMIPALAGAEFLRYGMIHRNTFIDAPRFLAETWQFKEFPKTLMAGQVAGVEGYVESAASGMMAGIQGSMLLRQLPLVNFPPETAMGALARHISTPNKDFQPMNINFGLFPDLAYRVKSSREKKEQQAKRAIENIQTIKKIIL
jgi:methylenetetrahydrofolate--tRNA-(uracil-5-)-methyltransferase